jgi:SAM-dependent methyltransferase
MKTKGCPLCFFAQCKHVGQGFGRNYYYCPHCELVHVPQSEHVCKEREKQEYDLHENNEASQSYCRYLGAVADEIATIELEKPKVLDFGSCEEFVLTKLLRQRGYDCTPYDPLYDLSLPIIPVKYDIVVLCEVIEHLRKLREELKLVKSLLNKGGVLYIRTQFYGQVEEVKSWWYANDVTHINFFNEESLRYVAQLLDGQLYEHDGKRKALIRVK